VLLELTSAGYVAHPMSQAMEVPETRAELRRELGVEGRPQLLLRAGVAQAAASTPRLPLADSVGRVPPS
jgi:hypothetical protein